MREPSEKLIIPDLTLLPELVAWMKRSEIQGQKNPGLRSTPSGLRPLTAINC